MSFQNFDSFQNQHPPADATAATGAPGTADTTMTGQADPSPAPFQGPNPGEPSAAPVPQQAQEGKTTLWYVQNSLDKRCGSATLEAIILFFSPAPSSHPCRAALLSPSATFRCEHVLTRWICIRMGELEPWIDENFIRNLWFQMGEQVNVKMIRDKFSG